MSSQNMRLEGAVGNARRLRDNLSILIPLGLLLLDVTLTLASDARDRWQIAGYLIFPCFLGILSSPIIGRQKIWLGRLYYSLFLFSVVLLLLRTALVIAGITGAATGLTQTIFFITFLPAILMLLMVLPFFLLRDLRARQSDQLAQESALQPGTGGVDIHEITENSLGMLKTTFKTIDNVLKKETCNLDNAIDELHKNLSQQLKRVMDYEQELEKREVKVKEREIVAALSRSKIKAIKRVIQRPRPLEFAVGVAVGFLSQFTQDMVSKIFVLVFQGSSAP